MREKIKNTPLSPYAGEKGVKRRGVEMTLCAQQTRFSGFLG
jgi:hypothetical protein